MSRSSGNIPFFQKIIPFFTAVITSVSENLSIQNVLGLTYVRDVEAPNLKSGAQSVVTATAKLKFDNWRYHLQNHPNKLFVNTVLDYIKYDVPIGYTGPHYYRVCNNWPSTRELSDQVNETLIFDV